LILIAMSRGLPLELRLHHDGQPSTTRPLASIRLALALAGPDLTCLF
jgi:hypothetical protein